MQKRIEFEIFKHQFSVLPTLGVTWGGQTFKFNICFMWLCFGLRIGTIRRADNENDK